MTPKQLALAIGHAPIQMDPDSSRFGKKIRRCLRRGETGRRHIVKIERNGREYTYHATKGWRENKA